MHEEEDTGHRKDKDVELRQRLECDSVSHRSQKRQGGLQREFNAAFDFDGGLQRHRKVNLCCF